MAPEAQRRYWQARVTLAAPVCVLNSRNCPSRPLFLVPTQTIRRLATSNHVEAPNGHLASARKLALFLDGASPEVATDIDLTRPHTELQRQLDDVVSKHIDPAVQDLRAALRIARLNALKKALNPVEGSLEKLAAAVVPFTVAAELGTPMSYSAAIGFVTASVADIRVGMGVTVVENGLVVAGGWLIAGSSTEVDGGAVGTTVADGSTGRTAGWVDRALPGRGRELIARQL